MVDSMSSTKSMSSASPASLASNAQKFAGVTPEIIYQEVAQYLSKSLECNDGTDSAISFLNDAHDLLTQALDAVEDELD